MILTESQFPVYLTQLSSGDQHIDSDSDSEYLEPQVDENNSNEDDRVSVEIR
jgi:hypothetical protein